MAAHSSSARLSVVMNKIVLALMDSIGKDASKEKRNKYRLVWSLANQSLWQIIHPDRQNPKQQNKKQKSKDTCAHPWPEGEVLRGFWITCGSSGGRQKGAREEILSALEPLAKDLDLECKLMDGVGKCFLFVAMAPATTASRGLAITPIPDLYSILTSLYNSGWTCRYCETITPLQWVGSASKPPSLEECGALMQGLLGPQLAAARFSVEYKCHHHQGGEPQEGTPLDGNARRDMWIRHFADSVPKPHTVDLKAPQVVIHLRLFAVGGEPHIGVSVQRASESALKCARDTVQYHALGSHGQPYYHAGINLNSPDEDEFTGNPSEESCEMESVFSLQERYAERLGSAVSEAHSCLDWATPSVEESKPDLPQEEHTSGIPVNLTTKAKRLARLKDSTRQVDALSELTLPLLLEQGLEKGLAQGVPRWTVEFGAGKGSLSVGIRNRCAEVGMITGGCLLVDRDRGPVEAQPLTLTLTLKMHHKLTLTGGRGGSASRVSSTQSLFTEADGSFRLRIDMANLVLGGVEHLKNQRIVGVGKHVCGAATDLALRCLVPAHEKEGGQRPGAPDTVGVAIALCCYHNCAWEAYCNQEWVCRQGFTAADFGRIVRMASWCHIETTDDTSRAKVRMARICKQFIDAGRALYLFERDFVVSVKPFVDISVTKENMCLLARAKK